MEFRRASECRKTKESALLVIWFSSKCEHCNYELELIENNLEID